jgi:elongation factor P
MLGITDLKPGTFFIYEGQPHLMVSAEHSKLGRGGSILRSRIRNLKSGAIFDRTFKGNEQFDEADVMREPMQFLYADADGATFMDMKSYEQVVIPATVVADQTKFLKEGMDVQVVRWGDEALTVEVPIKVEYEITYTEPGFKGNTQSGTLKPATTETGASVMVPLFVNQGDRIIIDTRTGTYIERAK